MTMTSSHPHRTDEIPPDVCPRCDGRGHLTRYELTLELGYLPPRGEERCTLCDGTGLDEETVDRIAADRLTRAYSDFGGYDAFRATEGGTS